MPVRYRPIRIRRDTTTTVGHILINSFINKTIVTVIIKTDICDHFPTFLISNPLDQCPQKKRKFFFISVSSLHLDKII